MTHNAHLRIIRDSREQNGFAFADYPATVEVETLASGDYSLQGFENRIGIERKSLSDLLASISTERPRFERELARLRGFDCAAVVVEEPAHALRSGRYRSQMDPAAAWQSVIALSMRYRVPFFWAENRADAERICFDCLRHFQRDRVKELQALRIPAPSIAPVRAEGRSLCADPSGDGDGAEGQQEARTEPVHTGTLTVNRVQTKSMGPFLTGAKVVIPLPHPGCFSPDDLKKRMRV
jgi:DNA excision repair protein ERCC-4